MAWNNSGWGKNANKYGARKVKIGDKVYHSALEAGDAKVLQQFQKNGEISELKEQVRYKCYHNGDHIVDSIVDFQFLFNGITVWYESKGMETDKYRVVKKLILADMKDLPDQVYIVNMNDLNNFMRGRLSSWK